MNIIQKRMSNLLRHIENVKANCETIGHKLIDQGKVDEGVELVARGQIHDNSKFYGIQWLYLNGDSKENNPEMFKLAAKEHITTNDHHPEFHGSIHFMNKVQVGEMVADWAARSSEFGNDIHEWIKNKAMVKYLFDEDSEVYETIEYYLNLLLDKPFA